MTRTTYPWPYQDTPGWGTFPPGFGSAHANIFNMSMCDGSVHAINYNFMSAYSSLVNPINNKIPPNNLHEALSTRNGAEMIPGGAF